MGDRICLNLGTFDQLGMNIVAPFPPQLGALLFNSHTNYLEVALDPTGPTQIAVSSDASCRFHGPQGSGFKVY